MWQMRAEGWCASTSLLLHDVGQLVGEGGAAARGCKSRPRVTKHNVMSDCVRRGSQAPRGCARIVVIMDADATEVVSEARFHLMARPG